MIPDIILALAIVFVIVLAAVAIGAFMVDRLGEDDGDERSWWDEP